jgi:hypothetical protein
MAVKIPGVLRIHLSLLPYYPYPPLTKLYYQGINLADNSLSLPTPTQNSDYTDQNPEALHMNRV